MNIINCITANINRMNIQCVIIKGYFETLDKNIFSASSSTILQDFLAVYKRWRIIDIIFVAIGRTLIMINLINLAIVNIYNPQKRNPKLQSFSFNKVPRLREFFRHTLRENGIILQEGRERIWVESLPPAPFSWWQPGPEPASLSAPNPGANTQTKCAARKNIFLR